MIAKRRQHSRSAERHVGLTDGFRDDVTWRRKALGGPPEKAIQFARGGCSAWRSRSANLKERALTEAPVAAATLCTYAASKHGWGATSGDRFARRWWPRGASCKGVKWKEFWALGRVSAECAIMLKEKLLWVRMDSATAVAYAKYDAGRSTQSTVWVGSIKFG